MSRPFPGMDPYLEGPLWSTVRNSLIEEIARQLTPRLWPRYKVRPGERVVVAAPDPVESIIPRERLPDVSVFATAVPFDDKDGASATVSVHSPLVLDLLEAPPTIIQTFVEIRAADGGQLVTAIEVLSPTNKRGPGAVEYQIKRREILASETHFMEIDLLRVGERFPVSGLLPSVPYFVFLSRSERRPRIEKVWPIALDAPLPSVPVPLLKGELDVELDLQSAFQTIFDLYHYESDIDYSSNPPIPFGGEQAEWVDQRLRNRGLRSTTLS